MFGLVFTVIRTGGGTASDVAVDYPELAHFGCGYYHQEVLKGT
jgi:hypothetical protein